MLVEHKLLIRKPGKEVLGPGLRLRLLITSDADLVRLLEIRHVGRQWIPLKRFDYLGYHHRINYGFSPFSVKFAHPLLHCLFSCLDTWSNRNLQCQELIQYNQLAELGQTGYVVILALFSRLAAVAWTALAMRNMSHNHVLRTQ